MMRHLRIFLLSSVILMTLQITAHAQPQFITDIPSGSTNFTTIGDLVYFTTNNALWRTDGTSAGTFLLKNVSARSFREFKGNLIFISGSFDSSVELWRSDGTPGGTIRLLTAEELGYLHMAGNYFYFNASQPSSGREIYRTDGTPGGTILVKDIYPGAADGVAERSYYTPTVPGRTFRTYPSAAVGDELFFAADNGTHGVELWKTDGSSVGTMMIKDINSGPGDGFKPGVPGSFGGKFYFTGFSLTNGWEPWISDGTAAGTQLLKEVVPGPDNALGLEFKVDHNGSLYFWVETVATSGYQSGLWKTGGTAASTVHLKQVCNDCTFDSPVLSYNDKLYFFLYIEYGREALWESDGTPDGTRQRYSDFLDGDISFFDLANDQIFFSTRSQGYHIGLHALDPEGDGVRTVWKYKADYPIRLSIAEVRDLVFFADHWGPSVGHGTEQDPEDTYQLLQTDGGSVQSVRDIHGISLHGTHDITDYQGKVVFTRQDDSSDPKGLWIYDPASTPANNGSFTLVNADTDEDIERLVDGDVIRKTETENINIRYNPVAAPGSVVFHLNDVKTRTETAAPYSLAGDVNGDYAPWNAANPGTYELTATPYSESGGQGTAGSPLTITFTIEAEEPQGCTASGTILREQWNNVSGNNVSAIPVNTPPNSTSQLNMFEGPANSQTNFGARIRGYICPPVTGNYTFWIASNDNSELWLSTDDSPATKVKIAHVAGATTPREWTKFSTQKSAAINLASGKRYYIEALHKQGAGTHNIAVGWQLPDGTLERPIPGNRLSPFTTTGNESPIVLITYPQDGQSFNQPATINIEADASDHEGDLRKVEFFEGANKLGEDLSSPYGFSWTNVQPGTYSLTARGVDGQGATGTSQTVTITVNEGAGACTANGTITREYWAGVSGDAVSDIPLNTSPTSTNELTIFEGPTNIGTNYGTRIRGYICPPVSGGYNFWIASNDHSELWLSTDDNPSNKIRIAYVVGATAPREWNKYRSQLSSTIALEAGKRYYIEALHKQGVGTDNIAVGWQWPDGTLERPIPGIRLSPFEMNGARMATSDDDATSQVKALYAEINIFPNPVKSGDRELTIAGYERVQQPVETVVEIINITGEVIFAERIRCGGNCSAYLMNIKKQLVPGVYLVNLNTNGARLSKRLLVK